MSAGNSRTRGRVRYAVVGLGHIAQVAVLPAFAHASQNSELAALVSGSAQKRRLLSRRYRVTAYGYEDYEALLENGLVDAVYLAVPNHLHCEFAVRAAQAGVHVLCEKPMAVNEEECRRMLEAAAANGVKLMIAYRLHFEGANLSAMALARSGRLGELRLFQSTFSMQVKPGNVRLVPEGGGPLHDLGVYCINAARYLFGAEPDAVSAHSVANRDPRFREVEEALSAILHFPGERIAAFTCSFGAADVSSYRIVGTRASLEVEPAYEYASGLAYTLTRQGRKTRRSFPKRDQFAPELLHFSSCIREGKQPEPSGEEGLIDVQIVNALHRAAASGRRVELATRERRRRPAREQERRLPPVRKPRLVRVESASA